MQNIFKSQFRLDPNIVFLNHGSYGSTPIPVQDNQNKWRAILENQPCQFLGEDYFNEIIIARQALANYLDCDKDSVVYTINPTTAINMIIPSLEFGSGDEILSTNHEYGALVRTWDYHCQKRGAAFIRQPVELPIQSKDVILEQFLAGVTSNTKIIFISQMTSPTALIFPVKEICDFARQNGILSIVDGAHIPGHCPLSISELNPDIYTGACHKWMCAPKGSAFLYMNKSLHSQIKPFIISWGYKPENERESKFLDYFQWTGTCDPTAWLATPAAIQFQKNHQWNNVQENCHQLLSNIRTEIQDLFNSEPICSDSSEWYRQMAAIEIPTTNPDELKTQLLQDYSIEIPVLTWNNKSYIRISIQAYNTEQDGHRLVEALTNILKTTQLFNSDYHQITG